MSKIEQIIDPSFRSGTGKTGKPWAMMKVLVDGKEASIFAPASVGDEVELKYNEQYKNYNAEKITAKTQERAKTEDTLQTILSSLGRIERHLGITGIKEVEKVMPGAVELPPVENYDEPVDLSNIPFWCFTEQ